MDEYFTPKYEHPKPKATFLSKLLFLWMVDCSKKSNTKTLELEDIYKCPESHQAYENGNRLYDTWTEDLLVADKKFTKPKFLRSILKTFHLQYYFCGFTAFINYVVIKGLQPIILSNLIRLFVTKDYTILEMTKYGGGLCLLSLLSTFFLHHTVSNSNLLAMKIKVAVSSIIYRKILKLSQQSLNSAASGQVINLISNDLARFDLTVQAFHFFWLTPCQLLVIIYVIWMQFGPTTLIGIAGIILVIIPFEGLLGHLTGIYRKKAAVKTDYRIKIMNEILSGIQLIKMYAWERAFEEIVKRAREMELKYIKKTSYIRGIIASMMFLTERLGLCLTVFSYSLLGYPVRTDIVFSLSVCFRILQYSLGTMLPSAITIGSEFLVAVERIESFLLMEEKNCSPLSSFLNTNDSVMVDDVTASWNNTKTTLERISIKIPEGKLCAVVGPVASGKSSLLQLLLGELPKISGTVKMEGKLSYSSQKPWLFASTIRNNIIFNEDFEESRYKQVISICGLIDDLSGFPQKDKTVIGSKGISLSGGQKARISLARAVYRKADIYLFDDTLSALDTRVGKHVFQECILKFLKGNTRIFVTHQLQYLKDTDLIVVLNKGNVEAEGNYSELSNSKLDFTKLLPGKSEEVEKKDENESTSEESKKEENFLTSPVPILEDKIDGKSSVLWKYLGYSTSVINIVLMVFLLCFSQIFLNLSDYWITLWSEQENIRYYSQLSSENVRKNNTFEIFSVKNTTEALIFASFKEKVIFRNIEYVLVDTSVMRAVYLIIIFIGVFFLVMRSVIFFNFCMKSSQILHDDMFHCLLKAPMKFFNTNPAGNTINRFSKDIGAADEFLPKAMINVLGSFLIMFGSMMLIFLSNQFMIILIIPLWLVLFKMRKWFLNTVKSLKRIETAVKSPVFSYISSTTEGVITIRATQSENKLIPQFDRYQDIHTSAAYLAIVCSSAFGLWLDLVCIFFVCCLVSAFTIMDKYMELSGSFIGLAIFQSMTIVGLFQFSIRTLSETVNHLISVERVLDYTQLEREEDDIINSEDSFKPSIWPSEGAIDIKHLSLTYNIKEEPVLNNISVEIDSFAKIGIVGRTGAGKSSLISALLRLQPTKGTILIDGKDITTLVKLKDLRKNISVIPQDPILFSTSIRFNLDPFYEFTDETIWKVLDDVDMRKSIATLDSEMNKAENIFSVGQRQLLCLGRAILRKNKVLILDEATANVDIRTDDLIQRTIRDRFKHCTVLTISHRLNSIIDSDKVLVMEDGRMVEFDHPHLLLKKKGNGYFYKLAEELGQTALEYFQKTAEESFTSRSQNQSVNL